MTELRSLFIRLVQENFEILERLYGFHRNDIGSNRVSWTKDGLLVSMEYDCNRSYEVMLFLSGPKQPQYTLDELSTCAGLKECGCFQASNERRLEMVVRKISTIFREICETIDIHDGKIFEELAEIRKRNIENYSTANQRTSMTAEGDILWQKKCFGDLVRLYEQNKELLSDVERARLQYARKKMREDIS